MYLWGSQRINTLQTSYLQVLPSLHCVLDSHSLAVAEEVVYSIRYVALSQLLNHASDSIW